MVDSENELMDLIETSVNVTRIENSIKMMKFKEHTFRKSRELDKSRSRFLVKSDDESRMGQSRIHDESRIYRLNNVASEDSE